MVDQDCLPYRTRASFGGALQDSLGQVNITPLALKKLLYETIQQTLCKSSKFYYLAETEIMQGENKEEQYQKIK